LEKLVQKFIAAGEMLNRIQDYFSTLSTEELEKQFEESKYYKDELIELPKIEKKSKKKQQSYPR
jgi:hypothetical protein